MTREEAAALALTRPAALGRLCGFSLLRDDLHGQWMREMLLGREDMTLLAHRASYKTTCLSLVMALRLCFFPRENTLFFRKTDANVTEIIRQVKGIWTADAFRAMTAALFGTEAALLPGGRFEVNATCRQSPRGAPQLLCLGIGASITGKHADVIFTDDIVNLRDRLSAAERRRTRAVWMELQNIRNRGGRIVSTATPWHPEDAVSLMPNPRRFDVYSTGLVSAAEIAKLKREMSPALFAANYELRHLPAEDALFPSRPDRAVDAAPLADGIAHLDASYGGGDGTALTLANRREGRLYLLGRLWQKPADSLLGEIAALCRQYRCEPLYCETNGDKGFLARALREEGLAVRTYRENENKHIKIATHLRRWWPDAVLVPGTDEAWVKQILDYSPDAAYDDAPDSAACACRILQRREERRQGLM